MSLWEYKHITSGPHGFATPALLESYLNQLGKDEWEIISYQNLPNNPLAFSGIARRTTVRDWTLESAAAAAAKLEADKLRAEFAAKFQGNATTATTEAAEKPSTLISESAAADDGYRKLRDTERDADPEAHAGEDRDEWDNYDDDLPNFFEAIKPHLRKNQRGNGQSVGVTFLAKRWEQAEGDMIGALKECGFSIPETEDTPPEYLEFEGDLYWLNLNNRHELFINTREKPRPVFRIVSGKKLDPSDPSAALLVEEAHAEQAEKAKREAERLARETEQAARRAAAQLAREAAQVAQAAARAAALAAAANPDAATPVAPLATHEHPAQGEAAGFAGDEPTAETAARPENAASPLPQGEALLDAIRPQMRRNRRGPGYSGSTGYLARAFKHTEAELVGALAGLGLHVPESANAKPVKTTLGAYVYWLNKDARGGIWINGDEAPPGPAAEQPGAAESAPETPASAGVTAPGPEAEAPREITGEAAIAPLSAEPTEAPRATAEEQPPGAPLAPAPGTPPAPANTAQPAPGSQLAALRLLLKPNKRGTGVSAETGYLARALGQDLQVVLSALSNLGLALPATEEHKPSFVAQADEIYWLNKNPKDGSVWLNAKAAKAAVKKSGGTAKPRAKKPAAEA